MPDYSYPSWLVPREAPWQALVAGAQVGSQIAANRARNQALYAQIQQQHQEQDLQERQFVARNSANTLANEVVRLKMTNDTQDFEQLRAWWPKFSEATGDSLKTLELPSLRNPDQMQKVIGMLTDKRKAEGVVQFAEVAGRVDLATPEGKAEYFGVVRRNPFIAGGMGFDKLMEPIKVAENLKRLDDIAKKEKETAAMSNLNAADDAEAKAKLFDATNPEKATALRRNAALLRSTLTSATESIETYTDANGVPQVRVIRGPNASAAPKDLSTPTVATASQIQQRMLAADKTIELGAKLMGSLTDADVGVRGNVNQVVINEGLAQLIPGLQKGQVTEARTMLGQFNENAMKAIASDPRISDRDRQRYEKILPTLGAVESIASAKDKIKVFMDRFRDQSRTDAIAAKLPIPNWALTVSELQEKIAKKELTLDEATKILVRYHP